MDIDLHHLLLENRAETIRQKDGSRFWALAMKFWAHVMARRGRLRRYRNMFRVGRNIAVVFLPRRFRRRLPPLPPKTFAQLWKERESSTGTNSTGTNDVEP